MVSEFGKRLYVRIISFYAELCKYHLSPQMHQRDQTNINIMYGYLLKIILLPTKINTWLLITL